MLNHDEYLMEITKMQFLIFIDLVAYDSLVQLVVFSCYKCKNFLKDL